MPENNCLLYFTSFRVIFGGRAHLVLVSLLLEGEVPIYSFGVCSHCHLIENFLSTLTIKEFYEEVV